ncbi:MAG: T9SS type A sorting domain-containing protein [Dysgonamonadaceae bacterium]|jgi:hypothetical protein|nr:T9SS type A sorting domain-containing protein [Dysgonamonadaceae bacterium]
MKHYLVALVVLFHFSVFAQQDVKGKVVEIERPAIEIALSDSNVLTVKNAKIGSKIEIYSIIGTKVKEIEMKSTVGEFTLSLPKSIYIIRLGEIVRKYVIK